MTSLLTLLLIFTMPVFFLALALRTLYRQQVFDVIIHKWRTASRLSRAISLVFLSTTIVYGSDKLIGGAMEHGMIIFGRNMANAIANKFAASEITTGYAVASIKTNEVHDFTMPEPGHIAEHIARRGANNDGFWLFDSYTNALVRKGGCENPVWVHTDGTITVNSPACELSIERLADVNTASNVTVYSPLQGNYGFIPSSKWNATSVSRIWTAMTDYNSRIVTWEGAALNRSTSHMVSFQAEFLADGDVFYRYSDFPTNGAIIGIYRNGSALIAHDIPANLTSVLMRYIGDLGDGAGDTDGDGLTDWQEVASFGTDPRSVDTDCDGLSDCEEINRHEDPLNPDSNGDGVPDGFTTEQLQTHRLFKSDAPDRIMTVTLLEPVDASRWAVLKIGDLPILLNATNTWILNIPTGTVWNVELKTDNTPVKLALNMESGLFSDGEESIFSTCDSNSAYSPEPLPEQESAISKRGAARGSATITCPVVYLSPYYQVVHGHEDGLVELKSNPPVSIPPDTIMWTAEPWYDCLNISSDNKSAYVYRPAWGNTVVAHAKVGSNPQKEMSSAAIVEFCDGKEYFESSITYEPPHTNATIGVGYVSSCGHNFGDSEYEFQIEIEVGRETSTGWQHIAWLDTDTGKPGMQRRSLIKRCGSRRINWDMKSQVSLPLSDGVDIISYSRNYRFTRALPAIIADGFVPPPFVDVITRTFSKEESQLHEAARRIHIPQYVQISWDSALINAITRPITMNYRGSGNTVSTNIEIYAGCDADSALSALSTVVGKTQSLFPQMANVIVVGPDQYVPQLHKTISLELGPYYDQGTGAHRSYLGSTDATECHERNESPSGTSKVYVKSIRRHILEQYGSFFLSWYYNDDGDGVVGNNDWDGVALPFSTTAMANCIAQVALHECGHAMGLTPVGIGNDSRHNSCQCGKHHMDDGVYRTMLMHLELREDHVADWQQANRQYLESVFPRGGDL